MPFLCHFLVAILATANAVEVDHSALISVAYRRGSWKIIHELVDWWTDDTVMARANFTNAQNETGWMYLEIQTRESAPDALQAQAAGLAEGYLTRTYIVESYKEFYGRDICSSDPDACVWLKERFRENTRWLDGMVAKKSSTDPYWHQVNLMYLQMNGMRQGYQLKSIYNKLSDDDDDVEMDDEQGVLLLNFIADFWDMIEQYKLTETDGNSVGADKSNPSRPSCTVLIKHLAESGDLLFAHNTWHEYRAMAYRILKNYNFNYHVLPDSSEVIPGHTIAMSSYAGTAMSLDDFYLISSGLAATETTLFVYDKELLRDLKTEGILYEPIRVMIANRMAQNGSEWAEIFRQHNSGTYNNEWMIADFNLLKESPNDLKDGVLTVLEQLPGHIVVQDQTDVLREKGYWKSYNRAFYPEVFEKSGASELVEQYGDWFTHDKTPRSKIIDRDQVKVKDIETLMTLMRYNDFENDPLAMVQGCTPENIPAGAIANRLDLSDPQGSCSFSAYDHMVGHWGYGCLDAKLASKASFPVLNFTAVAGPTHDRHPPFAWSTTNVETVPKFIPIDEFDFEPIETLWVLNDGETPKLSWLLFLIVTILLRGH